MDKKLQIVTVRHGESEANTFKNAKEYAFYLKSIKNDKSIIPLSQNGKEQAKKTGEYLKSKFLFDSYISSPFKRAKDTMLLMYPEVKIIENPLFQEVDRGIKESLTDEEKKEYFPNDEVEKKRQGFWEYVPPGGESWNQARERATDAVHSVLHSTHDRILITLHEHIEWLFRMVLLNLSFDQIKTINQEQPCENASVTVYEVDSAGKRIVLDRYCPWKNKE